MKEKIKTILIILAVIAIVGFLGYKIFKEWGQESLKEEEQTQTETKKEQVIKELTNKYNALTNWDEDIQYTIQLQNLLVDSDKPIIFTGYIDDVFKKNEQYYIRFVTDFLTTPEIHFVLKCDYEKIMEILNELDKDSDEDILRLKLFADYAVVAKVDDIKKIALQISGYPEGEEEATLEYTSGDVFIATGNCIDFSYIGED